jgi:hypothetical protein
MDVMDDMPVRGTRADSAERQRCELASSHILCTAQDGLRIEYTYEQLEAYLGISVPRFRARVMPARRVVRRPATPVSGSWPYHHRL